MEWIEALDRSLLIWVNGLHGSIMDQMMWHVSGKLQWIPLYGLLLYFVIKKYGKQSWIILLTIALLIVLSDQLSVRMFKDVFQRYRPCHNAEIADLSHLVNNKCGGKFGFVSSHTSNSFALAAFVGLLFGRKALIAMFIWATLIGLSRVYMAVHYPLDILGGAIFGIVLAYLLYLLMINIFKEKLSKHV